MLEEGGDFLGLFAVGLAEEDLDELVGRVVHLIFFEMIITILTNEFLSALKTYSHFHITLPFYRLTITQ